MLTNIFHLALERTWLAYNGTANSLASHAVVIAQFFFLREQQRHIGIACGVVMTGGGIVLSLFGMLRYLQQCRGLVLKDSSSTSGRAFVGTLFVFVSGLGVGIVCCGLLISVLAVGE